MSEPSSQQELPPEPAKLDEPGILISSPAPVEPAPGEPAKERDEAWRKITPEQFIVLMQTVPGVKKVKTATGWALVRDDDGELIAFWRVDMKMMQNTIMVRVS